MEKIYKYLNDKLEKGEKLQKLKPEINELMDDEICEYCKKNAIYNEGYNRIKLNEYSNEKFEIIIICWNDKAETKIHDHPEKGCILYLFEGELEETKYNKDMKFIQKTVVYSKSISYMDNKIGFHKIKCNSKALSIHIYSPPNHKMKIMNL